MKYSTMSANGGERTVLLVGFVVHAVFVGPDHAELAEKAATLLNEQESAVEREEVTA